MFLQADNKLSMLLTSKKGLFSNAHFRRGQGRKWGGEGLGDGTYRDKKQRPSEFVPGKPSQEIELSVIKEFPILGAYKDFRN